MKALLVLGNCLRPDDSMSEAMECRLRKALQIHEDYHLVVLSGRHAIGRPRPRTEASAMFDYLLERGVEHDKMAKEERSLDTITNIYHSKRLLGDATGVDVICSAQNEAKVDGICGRLLSLPHTIIPVTTPHTRSRDNHKYLCFPSILPLYAGILETFHRLMVVD